MALSLKGIVIFLTVFLSLYSGLHIYAWIKFRLAADTGPAAGIALALFLIIMILSPVGVRLLERGGFETLARLAAYVGFIWMGLLFLFVAVSTLFDTYRLVLFLGRLISDADLSVIILSHRSSFFISLVLVIAVGIYGVFEANHIRTERIIIHTSKIPESVRRLKIAQISDVHLGLIVGKNRLRRILEKVKKERPDILISTGDLVDGQSDGIASCAAMIRDIPTRYGKYAVTGNHEYYAGLEYSISFTEKAGFKMLHGEGIDIDGIINIAGVDDMGGDISEKDLLSALDRKKFTLFLKHRPLPDLDALGYFDLQTSGHTHKGQIFPFSLLTRLQYPVSAGLLKIEPHAYLYVSRGSGTWGPPIRFLAPPEVTIFELVYQRETQ